MLYCAVDWGVSEYIRIFSFFLTNGNDTVTEECKILTHTTNSRDSITYFLNAKVSQSGEPYAQNSEPGLFGVGPERTGYTLDQ